jgi:hypothetical protein
LATKVIDPGIFTLGFPHLADDRDHDRQAAAVVADTGSLQQVPFTLHLDVGPLREHRVEVRGEDEVRVRGGAGILAKHVAHLVHAHVPQAELREHALQLLAADLLLELGRRNLAEADLVRNRLRLRRLDGVDRALHRRILQEIGGSRGPALRLNRPNRQRQRQPAPQHRSQHVTLLTEEN